MATNNFYEITVILDANFDDKAIQVQLTEQQSSLGNMKGL